MTPDPEPATQEQRDYWAAKFFEGLNNIGNRPIVNGMKALRESKGYTESLITKDPRPKWIVGEVCPNCDGKGYYEGTIVDEELEKNVIGKAPCLSCDLTGKKEPRYEVYASSQAEADKAYKASF